MSYTVCFESRVGTFVEQEACILFICEAQQINIWDPQQDLDLAQNRLRLLYCEPNFA